MKAVIQRQILQQTKHQDIRQGCKHSSLFYQHNGDNYETFYVIDHKFDKIWTQKCFDETGKLSGLIFLFTFKSLKLYFDPNLLFQSNACKLLQKYGESTFLVKSSNIGLASKRLACGKHSSLFYQHRCDKYEKLYIIDHKSDKIGIEN